MSTSLRTRIGLWMARMGGILMILGGLGDLTIRRLLPNHRDFLGYAVEPVPPATETLILALLHALGAALIAAGVAVIVLVQLSTWTGRRMPAFAAAAVALLAEGMNAFGMYQTGSPLFIAPLSFLLLVVVGVAIHVSNPAIRGSRSSEDLN